MTKKIAREIKDLANQLPRMTYLYVSRLDKTEQNGVYKREFSQNDVNHERRLRKAYQANGDEGVRNYLKHIYARLRDSRGEEVHESPEVGTELAGE